MPHARQQIRAAIVTAVTGLTTTGSRVYTSRALTMGSTRLPGLKVWTQDEDVSAEQSTRESLIRQVDIVVEAYAKTADSDDALDDICAEVETAIATDPTLGGLAKHVQIADTDFEYDEELEKPAGVARMTWTCLYVTAPATPTVAA